MEMQLEYKDGGVNRYIEVESWYGDRERERERETARLIEDSNVVKCR